ncbi:branched-chain amino acid ABC transporter substrate-binding protein [Rubrobacter indicoceani]|uniref:branched-chain amino acid ABC transporter substrate-binding protein n=1 Tax=Rubrobacter indicoceani TaxID=2051957 RepID=UPI000E5A3EB9|nr:branched-chain amino acid ABC transporter substrate-binding protein [Rubrobacter indicoceani]
MRRTLVTVALGCAVGVVAAGCGGGGSGDSGGSGGGGGGEAEAVKIVSDLPLQGANRTQTESMVNAIQLAIEQRDGMVGDLRIEYESLDDSVAQTGSWDEARCAQNAQETAQDEQVVGWIGPFNSGCAAVQIPILNEAGLAMVSPANTALGLTKEGGDEGEPDRYYPTGERNYTRTITADDKQGRLGAVLMEEEGVERVFILDDREVYGQGLADQVEMAAEELGIEVVGREGIDGSAANYRGIMNRIAEEDVDAIYFGGIIENNAGQIVRDKVAAGMSNEDVLFVVPDGVLVDTYIEQGGDASEGTYATLGGVPASELGERGQSFVDEYEAAYPDVPIAAYTAYAYESANVMLDAIERAAEEAGGPPERAAVVEQLFATEDYEGVLGTWSFDEEGDTTLTELSVQRVENGEFTLDRVLDVSEGQ